MLVAFGTVGLLVHVGLTRIN